MWYVVFVILHTGTFLRPLKALSHCQRLLSCCLIDRQTRTTGMYKLVHLLCPDAPGLRAIGKSPETPSRNPGDLLPPVSWREIPFPQGIGGPTGTTKRGSEIMRYHTLSVGFRRRSARWHPSVSLKIVIRLAVPLLQNSYWTPRQVRFSARLVRQPGDPLKRRCTFTLLDRCG